MPAPNASGTRATGSVLIVITSSNGDCDSDAVKHAGSTGVVACNAAGGATGEAMERAFGSGRGRVMMDTEPDLLCVPRVVADALPWTVSAAGHGGLVGNGSPVGNGA